MRPQQPASGNLGRGVEVEGLYWDLHPQARRGQEPARVKAVGDTTALVADGVMHRRVVIGVINVRQEIGSQAYPAAPVDIRLRWTRARATFASSSASRNSR